MKNELLRDYNNTSAAMAYMIGFALKGRAYLTIVEHLKAEWVRLDHESSSHGGALKLRMSMSNTVKAQLLNAGAQDIGSVTEVLASRKNKGEAFEKWMTELNGQVWVKDSIPYYMDGDLTVNGIKYQIKWENASLTNEKVIADAKEYRRSH